jgi:hypothetical protein
MGISIQEIRRESTLTAKEVYHRAHADTQTIQQRSFYPGSARFNALQALYFTATDFRLVYEALWNTFCVEYCFTHDYWPSGVSILAQRNEVLDLALLALSAKRLSFDGYKELRRLGSEAYGKSLYLLRSQIQSENRTNFVAFQVVVCLLLALFEGSSLSREAFFSEEIGPAKHIFGALALMAKCGPSPFASPGLHEAFQKLRELTVSISPSLSTSTHILYRLLYH